MRTLLAKMLHLLNPLVSLFSKHVYGPTSTKFAYVILRGSSLIGGEGSSSGPYSGEAKSPLR